MQKLKVTENQPTSSRMEIYKMEGDERVRHKYYKGLRVIDVMDSREFVAWTEAQIGFRGEEDEAVPKEDYEILRILLRLYLYAFNKGREFRDLKLGARFTDQRYGFSFKINDVLEKDAIVPFINSVFKGILSMDTPDKMRALLNDKTVKKLTAEEEEKIAGSLVEGLNHVKSELEDFLKIINEDNRYVYIYESY